MEVLTEREFAKVFGDNEAELLLGEQETREWIEHFTLTRVTTFVHAIAEAGDDKFRNGLLAGVLSEVVFEREQEAYIAVSLMAENSKADEKTNIPQIVRSKGETFEVNMNLDPHRYFSAQKKVEESFDMPIDDLLANDDLTMYAIGLTMQAMAKEPHVGNRLKELEFGRLLSQAEQAASANNTPTS